jgi:hypothetical protein
MRIIIGYKIANLDENFKKEIKKYKEKDYLIITYKHNSYYYKLNDILYLYYVLTDYKNKIYYVFDKNGNNVDHNSIISTYDTRILNIFINHDSCTNIEVDKINTELDLLNEQLKIKCPMLTIKFKNYFDFKESIVNYSEEDENIMYLALCYNDMCVSTIGIDMYDNIIEILSKTDHNYEGRKYNKFLRIVLVLIGSLIICLGNRMKYIVSLPVNHKSAWLLISMFDVKILDTIVSEDIEDSYDFNLKDPIEIKDFISKNRDIKIIVPINESNINKSKIIFKELLTSVNGLKC